MPLNGETDMAESSKESKVSVDIDKAPVAPKEKTTAVTRFDEFERDMERMFENFMSRNWLRPLRDIPSLRTSLDLPRSPRVDLVERDHEVAIRAELAGYDKKDVKVSLTDKSITISASTRKEVKEEKGEYYRREISTGEVSRTLALPAEVDGTQAKAEFKDGILEVVIPKLAKSKRHDIEVK
jgi:HSP20 family protein